MRARAHWAQAVLAAAALVAVSIAVSGASASPQSKALIREGAAEMQAHRFDAALAKFRAAALADPADGDAAFFAGAALNRLGAYAPAIGQLQRAAFLRDDHPDLAFETGWSRLGIGDFAGAVQQLEAYERAHPGRGQTNEFLGRAYLGLGQFDKAQAALQEAAARDPALKPTVLLYLAQLEQRRGNRDAVRIDLQRLLDEAPEAPLSRTLREQLARAAPAQAKPWHLTVSAGAGYNSNVVALGNGVALPTDISGRRSAFVQSTLDAGYGFTLSPDDVLTVGYGLNALIYPDIRAFDLLDQVAHVDVRHAFRRDLYGTFRVSDEYTLVGGASFRNQVDLRPAIAYRATDCLALEAAYDAALADYYFPTAAVQNRDGDGHTLSLTAYFAPVGSELRAQLGAFYAFNNAKGTDFVYQSSGILAGVGYPLGAKISGEVVFTWSHDAYSNANSLAGAGFAFKRSDDVAHLTAQLTRPVVSGLSVYARYEYVNDSSNIGFFDFHQHAVSAGVIGNF
jgi:tetratricopeptide (TPR) repeat protein